MLNSGKRVKEFQDRELVDRRKLRMLDAAAIVADLKSPPGNCLELLKGDRLGQYSIRINGERRLCFTWRDGNARDVEIVD